MPDEHPTNRPWQEIANAMTHEQDSDKLIRLAKELDHAMEDEEREKVRKRLGLTDNIRKSGAA